MAQQDRRAQGRRLPLVRTPEMLVEQDVADALASTQAERIEAMIALLDGTYQLWAARGLDRDEGLCRFPRVHATGTVEKDLPDVMRLEALRDQTT